MTVSDIKFINPPSVPELYADYVMVSREGDNFAFKFYRQRPVLKEDGYEVSSTGQVIGLETERPEFQGVLQASIVLPFYAAHDLLSSLEYSELKSLYLHRSNAALRQAEEENVEQ